MLEKLKKFCGTNIPISIYNDSENSDKCCLGYVQAVNEEWVLTKEISPDGHFDGYCTQRFEEIFRVEQDTKYIKKLAILYELKKEENSEFMLNFSENILSNALDSAIQNHIITTIWVNNDSGTITGYVTEYQDDMVTLQQINDFGEKNGLVIIYEKDIEQVTLGAEDDADIDKLVQHNYGSDLN